MNRLDEICNYKREEILPLIERMDKLRVSALERNEFRSLERALTEDESRLALIAEVKKASPSAGDIDTNIDVVEQALKYEEAGANAISVLTDEHFFKGKLQDMIQVRQKVKIPVLRKDFVVHESQIYEACVAGADAILLIVAALSDEDYERLFNIATSLQLDVLVEVHSLEEIERALNQEVRILGVNNRNLKTFEVDIETTKELVEEVPDGIVLLSESGIKGIDDAQVISSWGVDGLLVGETLMRSSDPVMMADSLRCPIAQP